MSDSKQTAAPIDAHAHLWAALAALPQPRLTDLFALNPDRAAQLSLEESGLFFDFAKTDLTASHVEAFAAIAKAADLEQARAALFAGGIVNPSEERPAEHTAERGEGAPESVTRAQKLHERMRFLIEAIEADAFGEIDHCLHIGIGGSALGPQLVIDALGRHPDRAGRRPIDVAIVSNIDGESLAAACTRFDPRHTLIAVASKTFTTAETLLNAQSALEWMRASGVEDPFAQVVALTAAPERAVEWGVDETRILPFAESIGGRYSLWSSIGFPIALGLGWSSFAELLEGAAQMDRHFRLTPMAGNAPVLAAFSDLYYAQIARAETRAVFAYDERLRLLPPYLQQLEMESNGKSVTADGRILARPSAPVTWGGVGTDAQHAVFQLLHQGTHRIPVEFVAVIEGADGLDPEHHRLLLVNAFAQGAALMTGKASDDPARAYAGNRPSVTILLDTLDARTLGALLAFYEHRTFVNAVMLGMNPFDQFGVELGKAMASAIDDPEARAAFDPSTRALIERAEV